MTEIELPWIEMGKDNIGLILERWLVQCIDHQEVGHGKVLL